jgi:hypothetical protein
MASFRVSVTANAAAEKQRARSDNKNEKKKGGKKRTLRRKGTSGSHVTLCPSSIFAGAAAAGAGVAAVVAAICDTCYRLFLGEEFFFSFG